MYPLLSLQGNASLAGNDIFIEWTPPGKEKPIHSTLFDESEQSDILCQPWRTIVSCEGWKLSLSPGDQCELNDLNTDPFEMANRFEDPVHGPRIRDLTARIRQWQARVGDDMPLPGE